MCLYPKTNTGMKRVKKGKLTKSNVLKSVTKYKLFGKNIKDN